VFIHQYMVLIALSAWSVVRDPLRLRRDSRPPPGNHHRSTTGNHDLTCTCFCYDLCRKMHRKATKGTPISHVPADSRLPSIYFQRHSLSSRRPVSIARYPHGHPAPSSKHSFSPFLFPQHPQSPLLPSPSTWA